MKKTDYLTEEEEELLEEIRKQNTNKSKVFT
jgi:hypothetical protein